MKEQPKIGVAVIVRKGDTFLFGLRKSPHGAGEWGFPGGHLESGESWEACARRECEEETGIVIESSRFFAVTNDVFETGKHYNTIFLLAETDAEPQLCEPTKCEKWQWFPWEEKPDNLFLPIRNLIKNGYNPASI